MADAVDVRERRVASGSATLVVEDAGGGPAIVGLHAGVADRRSWRPLRAFLVPPLRMITYDRRGFGETEYAPERHDPVGDLVAVLDAAGVGEAILMGNSMGGRIALDAALRLPERVRALVLIGSGISGATFLPDDAVDEQVLALAHAIRTADEAGDLDEVNRLETHFWLDGPAAAEGRVSGPPRDLFLAMNGQALTAEDPGDVAESEPAFHRLGSISVPTLVLVGALDDPDVLVHADHLATEIPKATLVTMDDAAHLPQLERPAEVGRMVADFVFTG